MGLDPHARAVRAVTDAGHGLHGLVNNAGLGELGMGCPAKRTA
jgi:hypothetical protein